MPLQEAAPADQAVASFVARSKTVNEKFTTENGRVSSETVAYNATASGSKVNPNGRHALSEQRQVSRAVDGTTASYFRTVTVTSLDNKSNVKGFFQVSPFSTLTRNGKKDGDCIETPICYSATSTVVASDGIYTDWMGAKAKLTYTGTGGAATLRGVTIIKGTQR